MPGAIALVTGTLAEPLVQEVAASLREAGENVIVVPLKIQVAALLTADWVSRKLTLPEDVEIDRIILPGYCRGDLRDVEAATSKSVELGPVDARDLPAYLGRGERGAIKLEKYNLEIVAEINHASGLEMDAMLAMASRMRDDGADVIDVGCDPQAEREPWAGAGDVVRALRDAGHRVSIDSFQVDEVAAACAAGAELVLSVNSTNAARAADWGAEVVAIPDDPRTMTGLDDTLNILDKHGVPFRIDPIIEPIGLGFADSLGRYLEVRRRYPDAAMMMGVGNLSEMTEVDSAGVNMMLAGICEELGIQSVLTTQVINWARSSVAELDLARRIMRYAVSRNMPPKHLSEKLVMLRDPKLRETDAETIDGLAQRITDRNVRIMVDHATGLIHAMRKGVHAKGADPFEVFDELGIDDASHAFYLGYEMAKAVTALTLAKNYEQDEALQWGMLTREEESHYERRKRGR